MGSNFSGVCLGVFVSHTHTHTHTMLQCESKIHTHNATMQKEEDHNNELKQKDMKGSLQTPNNCIDSSSHISKCVSLIQVQGEVKKGNDLGVGIGGGVHTTTPTGKQAPTPQPKSIEHCRV